MKNMFDINLKSRTVTGGIAVLVTGIALLFKPDLLPGMDLQPSYLIIAAYAMIYGKS